MDSDGFNYGDTRERNIKQGRRAKKIDATISSDTLEDEIIQQDITPSSNKTTREGIKYKQSRRIKNLDTTESGDAIDDTLSHHDLASFPMKSSNDDSNGPPRPSRRKGGWGEEKRKTMEELDDLDKTIEDGEKLAHFEKRRPHPRDEAQTVELFQASGVSEDITGGVNDRLQASDGQESSDEEPDIPVIPELGEAEEEDLSAQVAMAPSVVVNRVATYRELDNELLRHAQFLTLDNEIDLKLLAKGLSAEQDIFEEDAPWDWERLFTEVTSELLTEWEKNNDKEAPDSVSSQMASAV